MPISGHLSLGKGEANQRANLKQRNVRPAPYGHETDRSLLTLRRRLCYADVTKLPAEDRKVLQDSARFHEVHATSALPSAILALCDGGGDGKLAEPGQKWNATCVITDPSLPGMRLIWAAVGGEYYVV